MMMFFRSANMLASILARFRYVTQTAKSCIRELNDVFNFVLQTFINFQSHLFVILFFAVEKEAHAQVRSAADVVWRFQIDISALLDWSVWWLQAEAQKEKDEAEVQVTCPPWLRRDKFLKNRCFRAQPENQDPHVKCGGSWRPHGAEDQQHVIQGFFLWDVLDFCC